MVRRGRRGRRLLGRGLAAGLVASGACGEVEGDVGPVDRQAQTPVADGAAGFPGDGTAPASPPIFRSPEPTTPDFGNTTTTGSGVARPEPLPPDFLGDDAVHRDAPARRVLYSWTTDEQYRELRQTPVLLTRTERPEVGGGLIRSTLAELAALGDPLSQALTAPAFERARYAWPAPWATLLGWPEESYGDRLIRIELREEAWIMTLHVPADGEATWQVFDMDDQPVPRRMAIEDPGRIGAIYHTREPTDPLVCGGSFFTESAGAFREYFLPNEAMVERWSLATEEMRQRLQDDIANITELRDQLAAGLNLFYWSPWVTHVACTWFQPPFTMPEPIGMEGPDGNYVRALAMASPLYEPSEQNLQALIDALEGALFEPDPFVHEP